MKLALQQKSRPQDGRSSPHTLRRKLSDRAKNLLHQAAGDDIALAEIDTSDDIVILDPEPEKPSTQPTKQDRTNSWRLKYFRSLKMQSSSDEGSSSPGQGIRPRSGSHASIAASLPSTVYLNRITRAATPPLSPHTSALKPRHHGGDAHTDGMRVMVASQDRGRSRAFSAPVPPKNFSRSQPLPISVRRGSFDSSDDEGAFVPPHLLVNQQGRFSVGEYRICHIFPTPALDINEIIINDAPQEGDQKSNPQYSP
jgi:hypothetical protein